jgi:hypothetical protein
MHLEGKPPAKRVKIRTQCQCGEGIRVTIFDYGKPLKVWEIACRKHRGEFVRVVLGYIHVTGGQPTPDQAHQVISKSIKMSATLVRTSGYVPFSKRIKF